MTNLSSCELLNAGHGYYFVLAPGFQTSIIALVTLWELSVKKMESLRKRGKVLRKKCKRREKNGGRVERN